jgi:hypothetical protein
LPLFALSHGDLQHGFPCPAACDFDDAGGGTSLFKEDTRLPALHCFGSRKPADQDAVGLGMAKTWMAEFLCQFTIIGQHHQPIAICIESPDGEEMPFERQHIAHRIAFVARYLRGDCQHITRLEDGEILPPLHRLIVQAHAIDFDDIFAQIRLVAQFGDFAIDAHAPGFDEFFVGAARANARHRHEFLQTFFHCRAFS